MSTRLKCRFAFGYAPNVKNGIHFTAKDEAVVQELEKFKFVLDFKIKELKRQIEPRENEIKDLKDKIRGRDTELERYHNNNASLDKSIGELRMRLNTLQRNVLANRTLCSSATSIYGVA